MKIVNSFLSASLAVLACCVCLALGVNAGVSLRDERYIPKAAASPTIDGVMSAHEWSNALTVSLSHDTMDEIVGSSVPTSCPDATFRWMWDEKGLYLFADIDDSTVPDTVFSPNTGHYNAGDGIQAIMFPDLGTVGSVEGELFIWSMTVASNGSAEVGEHAVFGSSGMIGNDVEDVRIACSTKGTAYCLEAFFPADILVASGTPLIVEEGTTFAMNHVVMEMDGSAQSLYADSAWFNAPNCNKYTLVSDSTGGSETEAPETEVPETEAPDVENPDSERLLGDVTGDGSVDMDDAVLLFRHSMLPEIFPVSYPGTLDMNEDGVIDIRDARRLFNYSMLPDEYPIKWGNEPEDVNPTKPYPVTKLTINGKDISSYVISYSSSAGGVMAKAASELQTYIRKTTGVTIPIRTYKTNSVSRILLDETMVKGTDSTFKVTSDTKGLSIGGDSKRGMLYAVYHFLEEFLGWRFFASDTEVCYEVDAIDLSGINYTFEHAYKIRDLYDHDYFDAGISVKRYQNGDGQRGAMTEYGGVVSYCPYGIHNFWVLNEESGEGDQPCLNDAAVRQRFVKNVRKFLDANWSKQEIKSIQISQNDNQRYCKCSDCLADIRYYGSPAGSIIEMMNLIAEDLETYNGGKYKDIYIITFAYQYSFDCPANIVCHPQVMVEYTIIDCCHQHALNDPTCRGGTEVFPIYSISVRSNVEVMEEIAKWAAISDHCYLYDYGANFRYYYSTFPNIDNLYENYKVLNSVGAWGYIVLCKPQEPSTEFGTLRNYLICKLTEDTDMTKEEFNNHIDEFLKGYYGNAWTYVKDYLRFTQKLSDDRGLCYGVYNSPERMYGPHAFAPYSDWLKELFEDAMNAPGLSDTQLLHVERLWISSEYLRLGAVYQTEMNSGDPWRQLYQRLGAKAFHEKLLELELTWVDEMTKLPATIDYSVNVRTWINNTTRHQYTE